MSLDQRTGEPSDGGFIPEAPVTVAAPDTTINITVWKDGSYLCQSVGDDVYCRDDPDWLCSIPIVKSLSFAHARGLAEGLEEGASKIRDAIEETLAEPMYKPIQQYREYKLAVLQEVEQRIRAKIKPAAPNEKEEG